MFNNNSYLGNAPFNNTGYVPYSGVSNQFQRPIMPQPQPQVQPQQYVDVPFVLTAYGTLDEVKAQMVAPTKAIMFIDKAKNEFYIKSCDAMGNPALETFKYSKVDENAPEQVSCQFDPKEFVKQGDLKDLLTKEDVKCFLTTENTKDFVTKNDLKALTDKLSELQKQIRINEILKGSEQAN